MRPIGPVECPDNFVLIQETSPSNDVAMLAHFLSVEHHNQNSRNEFNTYLDLVA